MKNKLKNLERGQKVWSLSFGKGTVKSTRPHIEVSFQKEDDQCFNYKGVNINYGRNQDLFLKKPVITTKKRLSYLNAESFGKGMMDGEHLERLFSENINIAEVIERTLSIASEHIFESEGSDFGIYMLKHQIADTIKGEFLNVHTMKPSKN